MAAFNPKHKAVFDEMFLGHPDLRPGKMFGFPAYYVGKKLCICLYEQGVGIKLPAQSVEQLLEHDQHAVPFQPLGKPKMREWVQINLEDSQDYREYRTIFEDAIHFLRNHKGAV
ncbi:MAG: hypothetical protein WCK35_22935 [Chloroflexota bacterium]